MTGSASGLLPGAAVSEYTAIRAVTRSLRDLLRAHITLSSDPELNGVPIDLRSPKEMREDGDATGVSLWLYRAVRNGHTLNNPPERDAANRLLRHPLPVNLYYLVTPIAQNSDDEQLLLGRVLQIFNDHGTVRGPLLVDALAGGTEEFRLSLEPLSLEELTRVWDALKEPYQLSVSYLVQVVSIDSAREPVGIGAVTSLNTEFMPIVAGP